VDLGMVLRHQARFTWDSRALIPFVPRPTHGAWPGGRPSRTIYVGAAGVPSIRPDAGATAEDTRGGLVAP